MNDLLGPPIFFWVMLVGTFVAFGWAIVAIFRRRTSQAVIGVMLGAFIGFAIWYFASTGGFCVAPPGAACA